MYKRLVTERDSGELAEQGLRELTNDETALVGGGNKSIGGGLGGGGGGGDHCVPVPGHPGVYLCW